jgi:nitrogen regulatory protein PII
MKSMNEYTDRKLIITVVRKGWGDAVIEASMKAGAAGGTIIFGRGMGIHEKKKIMGVSLEPEKEIVLSVVCANKADAILKEIVCATDLEKPGTGIAFMLPIDKVLGISHHFAADIPQVDAPCTESSASPGSENMTVDCGQTDNSKNEAVSIEPNTPAGDNVKADSSGSSQ